MPAEVFVPLSDKINASNEAKPNTESMLKTINEHFGQGFEFELTNEALELFQDFHDNYVLRALEDDKFDDTKAMLMSKSIGNVLRVAGVQCALRFGQNSINDENISTQDVRISFDDMKRAIALIKYSVECLLIVCSVKKTEIRRKRPLEMPKPDCVDREFLLMYKLKIQKMHANTTNGVITLSLITKNHYYPQLGKSSGADAHNFTKALELHGIGKNTEVNGVKSFAFIDKENANTEQMALLNDLGI